ncbi:hypothetical protein AVEN_139055-1 [Araneus ventricosus]|uniref:Uncharacterized protein n=1 Tax=Araneus ventricosus TaxID=182803 RepID=A0A4Y2MS46_ARAVE|nr:hypothetical protein AVEN_139055-1 [Araneus ventricosus]
MKRKERSHDSEVDQLKSVCVQAPVGLHVSLGPPAADDVDRLFAGDGTCASSNCSLYATNGMLPTGFKSIDTNRYVCKGPVAEYAEWKMNNV